MLGKNIASYHLQLDKSRIFLPIQQQNDPSIFLTGRLNLTLAQAASFKSIRVRVIGRMKTPRYGLFLTEDHEQLTFDRRQTLAFSKTLGSFTMPAGAYEFPFQISLERVIFDTLTGPNHEYQTYRVEATMERSMWRDIVVSQPVSIYRYPRVDIGRGLPKSIEGTVNQALAYNFSIPDTLVPHGCTFPVECWFAPLSKPLNIASITVRVVENHDLRFDATASEAVKYNTHFITSYASHVICTEKHDFMPEIASTSPSGDKEVKQVSIPVPLPGGEGACSQSFSSRWIKIEHALVVEAEFGDGGGMTKVTERIPIHIYMRPGDDGDDAPLGFRGLPSYDGTCSPPPVYERHKLDLMISGLDGVRVSSEVSSGDTPFCEISRS
ncbi:hypothetical protein BJX76DRAFT_366178 [Aspergillus varians]